jgi:hypothetical protein
LRNRVIGGNLPGFGLGVAMPPAIWWWLVYDRTETVAIWRRDEDGSGKRRYLKNSLFLAM